MNVDKGGFSQTLYNIFSFVNPGNFLFITSSDANKVALTSEPFTSRTLTYNLKLIPLQKNRLAKYSNRFINWFNYSINQFFGSFKKIKASIKHFNPDIVITAPNSSEGLYMHYKLQPAFTNKPAFPYFMDDWLHQSNVKWIDGNIYTLAKKILTENPNWLMISESLTDILKERYKINPAKVLVIHNPVDIDDLDIPMPIIKKERYTLAYAGALWPMHFDAFLIIANAINLLKQKRKIDLIVYTSASQWEWRKRILEPLGVMHGGHVPYKNIHTKLAEADGLVITSSFSKEWQTHSKGSVQTKITDYLKAGRLIISCGPSYSANHKFLKKYDCGICIETENEQKVANELNEILNNIEVNQKYIFNGFELLKKELSFEKVHQKLNEFLSAAV